MLKIGSFKTPQLLLMVIIILLCLSHLLIKFALVYYAVVVDVEKYVNGIQLLNLEIIENFDYVLHFADVDEPIIAQVNHSEKFFHAHHPSTHGFHQFKD